MINSKMCCHDISKGGYQYEKAVKAKETLSPLLNKEHMFFI